MAYAQITWRALMHMKMFTSLYDGKHIHVNYQKDNKNTKIFIVFEFLEHVTTSHHSYKFNLLKRITNYCVVLQCIRVPFAKRSYETNYFDWPWYGYSTVSRLLATLASVERRNPRYSGKYSRRKQIEHIHDAKNATISIILFIYHKIFNWFVLVQLPKVWLFFGCRTESVDLYREEKEQMVERNILDRVFLALSREQNVPKVWPWLFHRKTFDVFIFRLCVHYKPFFDACFMLYGVMDFNG